MYPGMEFQGLHYIYSAVRIISHRVRTWPQKHQAYHQFVSLTEESCEEYWYFREETQG